MIVVLQKRNNYYLLIIDMSLASDLSAHHDHSSLCHSLARNLRNKKIKLMRLQITGNKKRLFYLCVRILLEMSIEDCVRHLVAHLVCQYSKSGKRNLSVLELRIWPCVVFLQMKCCIVKITFPINFVNHGLMRKSAAQYLCLQIANLLLTVHIYCCCITACG